MRQRTRRRQAEQNLRHPGVDHSGRVNDRPMSMTAFFEYLHDHSATTDLAKALADVAMLRTTGAAPVRLPARHERMAS